MIDMILNFLTYALVLFLIACAVFGVIVFVLAVTWIQSTEERKPAYEQKASAPASGNAAPAAQRKRRRAAQGYQAQMP